MRIVEYIITGTITLTSIENLNECLAHSLTPQTRIYQID
jgi:hypothetical protein